MEKYGEDRHTEKKTDKACEKCGKKSVYEIDGVLACRNCGHINK